MMGPEIPFGFDSPPEREEMESVVLSDASASAYRSAMSSIPASIAASFGGDPLLSPPPTLHFPLSSPASGHGGDLAPSTVSSFLDPPSYADVVFSPFDSKNGDGSSGADTGSLPQQFLPRSARAAKSDYIKISVSNPHKEQETANSLVPGGGAYFTYLITTQMRSGFAANGDGELEPVESSVRRRFRDVVTLSDRLAESYRGFFIPPRPDKSVVESQVLQKNEFVEQRRSALEKYLRRLAEHPVIGRSDEFRVFLQAKGKLPLPTTTDVASRMLDGAVRLPKQLFGEGAAAQVAPQEVVQPAKGGRDLLRIFKELKQAVTNEWGGVKPLLVEEDKEFLEKKEKMQDLEQQLSNASQQAEALVNAQQRIGETTGEIGLAFIKLTKFETEEAVYSSQRIRTADTKNVATAAVKASRLYRELNAQIVKHLDTLHEYLGLMLAVNSAFSERASALLTVQTLMSDLTTLNTRVDKLEAASSKIFGGDRTRLRKIEELRETIRVTKDAKGCAIREYERIKENNRNELNRLNQERKDDFLSMLKGFAINQVAYSEKLANVWATVAEDTSTYARGNS
ncbi:LOW QUALITY PROTEIN: sorting nexin 2A-like [Curcuma longa]|uniref:LOW QUALITY PROTEIN: sorting nexin 2A-like n=1 Tax=Curcuma longa TaxID=136217 RepID=UPI003D9F3C11